MALLDANVILRYITRDNPDQAQQAYTLFQQLERGSLTLMTTEAVVVEVVYVLASKRLYNLSREEIRRHLAAIIRLPGLKLPAKRLYLRALDLYVAYPALSFVDVLNVAYLERMRATSIYSFDQDYDQVPAITRQEP